MDKIQRCVSNTFPCISYPHSGYKELRNWQISDQSTSERDVFVNSNNEAISSESMNVARSLEIVGKATLTAKILVGVAIITQIQILVGEPILLQMRVALVYNFLLTCYPPYNSMILG